MAYLKASVFIMENNVGVADDEEEALVRKEFQNINIEKMDFVYS